MTPLSFRTLSHTITASACAAVRSTGRGAHRASSILRSLHARSKERASRGTAAVEMAILTPVLVVIVLGAVDFGRAFYAYIAASSAAHEAAVYSSRFPGADTTTNALATVVSKESNGFLVVGPTPTPGGPLANKPLTTSGNTVLIGPVVVADSTKVPMAQVQVTYAFQPISPIPVRGPIGVTAVSTAPMTGDVLP